MYLEGDGVGKDKKEAEDLLKDAYLNGKSEAKLILDKEHWDVETQNPTLPEE
jgi:TPR repeat protein